MKKTIGEKIKEIRVQNNLTMDELAEELGYTSRSTINKIEKGINDISYEKLLLLLKKYDISMSEFIEDNNDELSLECPNKDSNLFISFSGRDYGNCYDVAHRKMNDNDVYVAFKDLSYHPCSKCNYECFKKKCKYRNDDIYNLIDTSLRYKNIVLLVPEYCSNPSSLYFIFNERMQDYFHANEDKWDEFINKINIVAVFGSEEETPLFIPTLLNLVNGNKNKILKIERHKYQLKPNDKVIDNKQLLEIIDNFSI
ncbi:MAG: helix-turn-helix domain-containing protein [Bacilli bacterium]